MSHTPVFIDELFPAEPKGIQAQARTHLRKTFNDSSAPVLMLSQHELRAVPGMGRARMEVLREMLWNANLRLRLPEERVFARARTLYGSVAHTPAQALLTTSTLSGGVTYAHYSPSPALAFIYKLDPVMTIGGLAEVMDDGLEQYFELHGASVSKARIRGVYDELDSRIHAWRQAIQTDSAQRLF